MKFFDSLFGRKKESSPEGAVNPNQGRGTDEIRMKAGEQVYIGVPAKPPTPAIQESLRTKAAEFPAIAELRHFQMATARGGSHLVIGIVPGRNLTPSEQQEIVRGLGEAARTQMAPDESMDFVFLKGSFGQQVRAMDTLIFRR